MKLAAQIGISVSEFWQMTPFELGIYANAYNERLIYENKRLNDSNIIQAYLISRWVWQKKVDIKKYLNANEKKKPMTDEEMLLKVKALNALFGGNTQRS